jgi:hypothetical protein
MRIVLPDRPGALGAVATALGRVGADILSLDVIERTSDCAIDDLVLELPTDRLADSLVTAAATVDGVRVESIRPYAGRIDPHRELELLDKLAEAGPSDAMAALVDGVARIFRAGWALVLAEPSGGFARVAAASVSAPEVESIAVPWWPPTPARELRAEPDWAPQHWDRLGTELAVAPLGFGAVLVGRPALRWLPSELVRLQHLAAIAAWVTSASPPV